MIDNIIFYFIFLNQILFVSWYVPTTIIKRMQTVMEVYPPSDFPKLYSKSIENYKNTQKKYGTLNNVLLIIGFSMMSAIMMWDYLTTYQLSPMIPWAYFMLQMSPLMWLELTEFKTFKAMRVANTDTTKKAIIKPRKLFDFISAKLLFFAIIMVLVAFAVVLVRHGFNSKAFVNIAIIIASNLFFSGIAYWNIYGKKMDPYQANEDRLKQIKVSVKSLVYISIGVSVFLSVHMLVKIFKLDYLQTSIMSIYCQLLVWASVSTKLKHVKLENIDFSVYKNNETRENNLDNNEADHEKQQS
ncbi:MAG: hypothetical protein JKY19_03605 [Alcanivoracaceae bacterium]|nr:hypothetical protein [Alcanivoracaceae bacterium]